MDRVVLSPFNGSQRGVVNGHYRAYGTTSAIAPNANAVLAAVRWVAAAATNAPEYPNQAPLVMVPLRISVQTTVVTAVTAQRNDAIAAFVQRSYTVSETTNVSAFTLSGNNAKMATGFGTSQFNTAGQMAVTSNAAGCTGGTKTGDTQPFGVAGFPAALGAIGTGTGTLDLYRADIIHGMHPLTLATNEGFTVQWGATALASGTVTVTVGVEWMEVVVY